MHRTKISVGRPWLLAAVAVVGFLAVFGSTADAAGTPVNYDAVAAFARFTIPGGPVTATTAPLLVGTQPAPNFLLPVTGVGGFPAAGQILVSDPTTTVGDKPGAEIMTYDMIVGSAFRITERGPAKNGMAKKDHAAGSPVHLATTLTSAILPPVPPVKTDANAASGGAIALLTSVVTASAGGAGCSAPTNASGTCPNPLAGPFNITINNGGNFPITGIISISHQAAMTPNVGDNRPRGTEYFQYDNTVGGANLDCAGMSAFPFGAPASLCIVRRGLQETVGGPPPIKTYGHPADGFPDAAGPTAGRSHVSLHFQANVKSRDGFFPSGTIMVCNPTNPLTNCELMGYSNLVGLKVKNPAPTLMQFHIDGRCNAAATFNKSCTKAGAGGPDVHTITHLTNSIVIAPDTFVVCRLRLNQPGVDDNLISPGYQEPASQTAGTSVGVGAVCYTRTQPKVPPKPGDLTLDQPIIGSTLIVINSIFGQPFLSTGGFCHVGLGPVDNVSGTVPDCNADGIISVPGTCANPVTDDGDPLVNEGCPALDGPDADTFPASETGAQCLDAIDAQEDGGFDGVNDGCPVGYNVEPYDTNGPNTSPLVMTCPCITDFTPGTNVQATLSLTVDKSLATDDVGTITVVTDTNHDATPGNGDECDDPASTSTLNLHIYDTPADAENKDDDTDRDGCLDAREGGSLRALGGLRDPWNPWDYFDTNHDGDINVVDDIAAVASAFGPGDLQYLPKLDRGATDYGPFGWNASFTDGEVNVVDNISGVAQQFGDPCPHTAALYTGSSWPAGNAPWWGAHP